MAIKVAKPKKQKPEDPRPFTLLDFMGNELKVGDTCIVAAGTSYSAHLQFCLVKDIKKCPATVRIYYQRYGQHWDWSTYTSCDYSQHNTRNVMFYRLDGVGFEIDKADAARLFVAKNDYDLANPAPIEPPEIEDDQ